VVEYCRFCVIKLPNCSCLTHYLLVSHPHSCHLLGNEPGTNMSPVPTLHNKFISTIRGFGLTVSDGSPNSSAPSPMFQEFVGQAERSHRRDALELALQVVQEPHVPIPHWDDHPVNWHSINWPSGWVECLLAFVKTSYSWDMLGWNLTWIDLVYILRRVEST